MILASVSNSNNTDYLVPNFLFVDLYSILILINVSFTYRVITY